MIEQPTKELIKLLEDLQSHEPGERESAIRRAETSTTSSPEIVSALLKIRETSESIAVIDLTRQALGNPAHQAILRQNPALEKNIVAETMREYRALEKQKAIPAEKAFLLKYTWIRADATVQWPAVCVRCGKAGQMDTHLANLTVPFYLQNSGRSHMTISFKSGFPMLARTWTNEYLAQRLQPPFCTECSDAIQKYEKVSSPALTLGGLVGLGVCVLSWIGLNSYFGKGGDQFLLLLGLGIAAGILTGWGAHRIYFKAHGDPARATTGLQIILRPENRYPVEKIGFYFENPSYGEMFRQGNQPYLTNAPER